MFTGFEQLFKQTNIKYTHITLNAVVAIKEFYVLMNQLENWSKVISSLENTYAFTDSLMQLGNVYLGVH